MKKNWVILVALIVIAAGVWWFYQSGSGTSVWSPAGSPTPTATKATTASTYHRTPTPAATPAMSYSQLVQEYGTNRIQFDQNCQAQPKSVVFKNGTSVMLDNRSSQARNISLAGKTYHLDSYGYQIVNLSSSTVPQTMTFQCDNLVNVGTVQLEANISGQ